MWSKEIAGKAFSEKVAPRKQLTSKVIINQTNSLESKILWEFLIWKSGNFLTSDKLELLAQNDGTTKSMATGDQDPQNPFSASQSENAIVVELISV